MILKDYHLLLQSDCLSFPQSFVSSEEWIRYNCVQLCKHIFMPTGSRLLCSNILHEKDVLKIAEYHSDIIISSVFAGTNAVTWSSSSRTPDVMSSVFISDLSFTAFISNHFINRNSNDLFYHRLQYFAQGCQVYIKQLRLSLQGKAGPALQEEENKIKIVALRTTSNINGIIKVGKKHNE